MYTPKITKDDVLTAIKYEDFIEKMKNSEMAFISNFINE